MSGSEAPAHFGVLLDLLSMERRLRVLDVGANPLTPPPYAPLLAAGGCDVTGFEPQEEAYLKLMEEAGPHETYLPHAVGKGGPEVLRLYRSEGLASFFDIYHPALKFHGAWGNAGDKIGEVPLETVPLDDVADLQDQDLLKIDVQGAERDVIESGPRVLGNAVAMVVEVRFTRLYENEPMFGEIDSFLRDRGLILHKLLIQKSRPIKSSRSGRLVAKANRSQLLAGDAVYIADMTRPETLGDEEMKRLALAAGTIFDSHDLALKCLDHLVERGAVAADAPDRYVVSLPRGVRRRIEATA